MACFFFLSPAKGLRSLRRSRVFIRWTPHPVIVTIRDNKDDIRVLLYSYLHYYNVGGPPKI